MAIPLTGTGGLFTRLGLIAGLLRSTNNFLGTASFAGSATPEKAIGPAVDGIAAQFQSADQNILNSLYGNRDTARSALTSYKQTLQALAQKVLIQMANDDTPLASQTLTAGLTLLLAQMKTAAASVNKPTCSATPTAGGSNVGSGVLVSGVLGANGLQRDYLLAETVTATCTADGQGAATAGQETFTLTSPAAEADTLQWDYPLGSGVGGLTLKAVDALVDNGGGNLLQNGSGKTYTNANQPDNWIRDIGSIGTTILQATGGNVYKGTSGNSFAGNGAELTSLYQVFGVQPSPGPNAGGTSQKLTPLTQYAVNLAVKVSAVPAAGVLEVALTDGTGTVVQDANAVNNLFTVSLPGELTSFKLHSGLFRTPAVTPATGYRLRVRLSTALDNAKTVYWGHLAMTPVVDVYKGGPVAALFSGAVNFILNDLFSLAVANNYAGVFQLYLDRLFGLKALGLQVPSSGAPTVADSLVS